MISLSMATVTGYRTGEFLGLGKQKIVQIKIESDPDTQDVLLISPPGDDSAPQKGDRIAVLNLYNFKIALGGLDNVEPESSQGEKKLYSTDSLGAISAFIYLTNSGILKLNGEGDNSVRFLGLQTGINKMATDINTELGKIAAGLNAIVPGSYTPSFIVPDISKAKIDEIEVPSEVIIP